MRLVTHNMLQCNVKRCVSNNFPLALSDVTLAVQATEYNPQFLKNILGKLDWNALVQTAGQLGITDLPTDAPAAPFDTLDESFLRNLHTILFETHVESGRMTCPNCRHVYVIRDGIPNMLLTENEVS